MYLLAYTSLKIHRHTYKFYFIAGSHISVKLSIHYEITTFIKCGIHMSPQSYTYLIMDITGVELERLPLRQ